MLYIIYLVDELLNIKVKIKYIGNEFYMDLNHRLIRGKCDCKIFSVKILI